MQPIAPPTIAHLRTHGVGYVFAMCSAPRGRHNGVLSFERISARDGTAFLALMRGRRFVCKECGSRDVSLMRDRPRAGP